MSSQIGIPGSYISIVFGFLFASASISYSAYADEKNDADRGTHRGGKPFAELQEQINALQSQIDVLQKSAGPV
jgi:hypothetical protein